MDCKYSDILRVVRGKIEFPTRRFRFRGDVSTDTRTIKKGDLYVPLRGKNYDGHDFISQALEKGARLILVEKAHFKAHERYSRDLIVVDDALRAYGRLASFHRRSLKIPVIAVTGSCGKTTTKDLIAHLGGIRHRVLKNEGTENNFVGVPKTLLKVRDEDVVVLELGSNRSGEIRYLSRMADPTHAVITRIGNAHLTGFKSVQGVKREKLSLIESLSEGSKVFYNGEDKNIQHVLMKRFRCVRVGFSKAFDYYGDNVNHKDNGIVFDYQGNTRFELPLLGRHNVLNALLAMAVAESLGVKVAQMLKRFKSFEPEAGRVRYHKIQGVHWIDDSYNSNPTSLQAAIELFELYPPKGRRILVLGDMLELGRRSVFFHREAGAAIARHAFDRVVTVGTKSREIGLSAIQNGFAAERVQSFPETHDATAFLKEDLQENDTVLLKGSREMKMETILEAFLDRSVQDSENRP